MTGRRSIHDRIAAWHDEPMETSFVHLHTFLGLTWEQYGTWVNGGPLPEGCGLFDPDRKEEK